MSHNVKVEARCPACEEKWVDHLGLASTCAELQRANAEIARLRLRLKEFEQERVLRSKRGLIKNGYK